MIKNKLLNNYSHTRVSINKTRNPFWSRKIFENNVFKIDKTAHLRETLTKKGKTNPIYRKEHSETVDVRNIYILGTVTEQKNVRVTM